VEYCRGRHPIRGLGEIRGALPDTAKGQIRLNPTSANSTQFNLIQPKMKKLSGLALAAGLARRGLSESAGNRTLSHAIASCAFLWKRRQIGRPGGSRLHFIYLGNLS